MSSATSRWGWGFAGSVLAHFGAMLALIFAQSTDKLPPQSMPKSTLEMQTVQAPRQSASSEIPSGTDATEVNADSTAIGAGAIPMAKASSLSTATNLQRPQTVTANSAVLLAPEINEISSLLTNNSVTEATALNVESTVVDAGAIPIAQASSLSTATSLQSPQTVTANSAVRVAPEISEINSLLPNNSVTEATELNAESTVVDAGAIATSKVSPLTVVTTLQKPQTIKTSTALGESAIAASKTIPIKADVSLQKSLAIKSNSVRPVVRVANKIIPSPPPISSSVVTTVPKFQAVPQVMPLGTTTTSLEATSEAATITQPTITPTVQSDIEAASVTAALAWQFGDRLVTDPQALATIQAFMAPDDLENAAANAGEVRDDLTSVLKSVKCARLSANFNPTNGNVELHGHVPDLAQSYQVIDALRSQLGDGIPVVGNLLHLPEPQCDALGGIADIGLPQSTDQFTNNLLLGETLHAREYSYREGQRLQFDLTAPDYDAFVYVDYFSADGDVIHLIPNSTIALQKHVAKSVVGVGDDKPGQPGLKITIGPPYGQEIAVAFAASQPLFENPRPIVEPANPYLDFLKGQVSLARDRNPNFKGEWVYFFITTSPATQ